jgi:hypothetical protein
MMRCNPSDTSLPVSALAFGRNAFATGISSKLTQLKSEQKPVDEQGGSFHFSSVHAPSIVTVSLQHAKYGSCTCKSFDDMVLNFLASGTGDSCLTTSLRTAIKSNESVPKRQASTVHIYGFSPAHEA